MVTDKYLSMNGNVLLKCVSSGGPHQSKSGCTDNTWPQAMLLWGRYVLFVQMCVSARCELFLADVIRWRWGRGKGTPEHPTRMRGRPLWKGGCMCMFVCAIPTDMLPRGVLLICVMFCVLSPPLLPSSLLSSPFPPLAISLSLLPPLHFSPSSLPLLSPFPLLFPHSLPSPTICPNTAG